MGLDECGPDRPPIVDYPKYASSGSDYSDLHHYDIKVPGEHILKGVQYDAEVQMFHSHLTNSRFSSLAVPIRATENGFNGEFQDILNEFQAVYNRHAAACAAKSRRLRGLDDEEAQELDYSSFSPQEVPVDEAADRDLQRRTGFNPYSLNLMPDHWFYRYDGSISEPPCLPNTWFVMDVPMIISNSQLAQLKEILFSHVDSNCQKTSVHNREQSVARPTQRRVTEIQHCQEGSFRPDIDIGRGSSRNCEFL